MSKLPKFITKTLSVRLSLMIVFAIALLLSLSLGTMFYFSRQVLKQKTLENAAQTLEGTMQHIDNILLGVEQSAGNVYFELLPHLNQPELMYEYGRKLVESNPHIAGCAIAFEPDYYPDHQLFMAHVHRKGDSIVTNKDSLLLAEGSNDEHTYTNQVWFTEPMNTKHSYWTDPLKNDNESGDTKTAFCLPIFDMSRQCVGVLAVEVPVGLFSQIVLSSKPSENSYTIMLSRNGSFIVHPDKEKLFHHTIYTLKDLGIDNSVEMAANEMIAGKEGYQYFQTNGEGHYVFYKPFTRTLIPGRTQEATGWSVGIVYAEEDIFGDYNLLPYYVLAIAIIGLIVFFVLCRWITHRQLARLRILTSTAQQITEKLRSPNADIRLAALTDQNYLTAHHTDEIGQLKEHFQRMQQSLATNATQLEKLTSALQEHGNGLRKMYKQTQEADHMKTAFLHNMTNQMLAPADIILQSVKALSENHENITSEMANNEAKTIQKQSKALTELLNHLFDMAESDKGEYTDFTEGKEDDHAK